LNSQSEKDDYHNKRWLNLLQGLSISEIIRPFSGVGNIVIQPLVTLCLKDYKTDL